MICSKHDKADFTTKECPCCISERNLATSIFFYPPNLQSWLIEPGEFDKIYGSWPINFTNNVA
jgi:hypothetical protein